MSSFFKWMFCLICIILFNAGVTLGVILAKHDMQAIAVYKCGAQFNAKTAAFEWKLCETTQEMNK